MRVYEWLPSGVIESVTYEKPVVTLEGRDFEISLNTPFFVRGESGELLSASALEDGTPLKQWAIYHLLDQTFEKITFEDSSFVIWTREGTQIVIPFDDLECGHVVKKGEGARWEVLFAPPEDT